MERRVLTDPTTAIVLQPARTARDWDLIMATMAVVISNADTGYGGYNPYYGDGAGYGVNYGGVNSGSYGNYAAPADYWNGTYGNGIYGNGYYGGAKSTIDLGYRGYGPYYGNNPGYGVNYEAVNSGSNGNYASPAYYGSGYYSKGIHGPGALGWF